MITVAAVLVLSRALYNSGVVDVIAGWYARIPEYLTLRIAALSGLTAFLSAFMNNVGAVSLLLAGGRARVGSQRPSPFAVSHAPGLSRRCWAE